MLVVKDKTIGVLGLGKSGQAAVKFLLDKGVGAVYGFDIRKISGLSGNKKVKLFFGPPRKFLSRVIETDFLIKSPGIPEDDILVQFARRKRKKIFSELSLGLNFCQPKKIIAVTGTNGKTTTATLIGHLLSGAGLKTIVAGNIGRPLTSVVKKITPGTFLVLEVSSYQLADTRNFHPDIAVILNITPDHLQHHRTFGKYVQAKKIVTANQTAADFLLLNYDDKIVRKISSRARTYYFSLKQKPDNGIYLDKNNFVLVRNSRIEKKIPVSALHLPGKHNQQNALAAILVAVFCGVKIRLIQQLLEKFSGVEHRLQKIGTYRGITYINDSKATNVASTMVALDSFPNKNIWLILGGLGKGFSYRPLHQLVREKVKGILLIGKDAPKIESDLRGISPIYKCQTLKRAVKTAARLAGKGDIVLLSPACASFDQFANFAERGRIFEQLVRELNS